MSTSKAEIAVAHVAYRKGIIAAQSRLREHHAATGGPRADGSVESLAEICGWFLKQLEDEQDDSSNAWVPAWWDPTKPLAGSGDERAGPFTGQQLRLIDEVHAYVAEVLMNEIPTAEWVIYKGSKKDLRNGSTVLQLKGRLRTYPLSLVYGAAIRLILLHKQVDERLFFDRIAEEIARVA